MPDTELPPGLTRLTFHGSLSEARAARLVGQVDQHRSFWLRGYYALLGQAYLTLVPAG